MATPHAATTLNGAEEPDDTLVEVDPPPQPTRNRSKKDKDTPAAPSSPATRARWLTEQAQQEDLQALFSTITMEDGLQLLAKMRQNCELAARTLEKRRTEETEATACLTCHLTRKQLGRNWRMVRPRFDRESGTYVTEYFCSDVCIIADNKKRHGIAAMSDRGMQGTQESVEARAKSSIIAHQEKMKSDKALAKLGEEMTKREKKARGE